MAFRVSPVTTSIVKWAVCGLLAGTIVGAFMGFPFALALGGMMAGAALRTGMFLLVADTASK